MEALGQREATERPPIDADPRRHYWNAPLSSKAAISLALETGALEGEASAPPWGTNPPAPKFDFETTLDLVKGTSEPRLAGLMAVRIAWITAILVCVVAILIGLVSGTGSGNSSRQFPGFAFSGGVSEGRDSSQQSPEPVSFDPAVATVGAAARRDRKGRAMKGAAGDSHYRSGVPTRSGSQPEDTGGGRTPEITPRPKPTQAPQGDPAEAPQAPSGAPPKPPQTSPVTSPEPSPAPPVTAPDSSPAPPEPPPAPPVIPAP
jgi:hypothetical protein